MAGFQADASQVEAFARQLHQAGVQLADLEPANAEAGREVITASRPPRRSGALSASLRADATRNGVVFASSARYWTFVHFGAPRRNVRAQPWYPQAIQLRREQLLAVYADHARDAFDTK